MNFSRGFGIGSAASQAPIDPEEEKRLKEKATEMRRKDPRVQKLVGKYIKLWNLRDVALGRRLAAVLQSYQSNEGDFARKFFLISYSLNLLASSPRAVAAAAMVVSRRTDDSQSPSSTSSLDSLVVAVLMWIKESLTKNQEGTFAQFLQSEKPWYPKQKPGSKRTGISPETLKGRPFTHLELFSAAVGHCAHACGVWNSGSPASSSFKYGDVLRSSSKVVMASLQLLFHITSPKHIGASFAGGSSNDTSSQQTASQLIASALSSAACRRTYFSHGFGIPSTGGLFQLLRRKLSAGGSSSPVVIKTLNATLLQIFDYFGGQLPQQFQPHTVRVLSAFTQEYLGNTKLDKSSIDLIVGKLSQAFAVKWFSILAAEWEVMFYATNTPTKAKTSSSSPTSGSSNRPSSTQLMHSHLASANVVAIGYTFLVQEKAKEQQQGQGESQSVFSTTFTKLWLQVLRVSIGFSSNGGSNDNGGATVFNHLVRILKEATPESRWLQDKFALLWSETGFPLVFSGIVAAQQNALQQQQFEQEKSKSKKKGFFAELREKKPTATEVARQERMAIASFLAVFEEPDWLPVAHLMLHLMSGAGSTVALTLLSRAPKTLPPLWDYCMTLLPYLIVTLKRPLPDPKHVASGDCVDAIPVRVLLTAHVSIALFASLFSLFLTVLDDHEFIALQVPFPLVVIKEIVEWCNRLLYLWNVGQSQLNSVAGNISSKKTPAGLAAGYLVDSLTRDELQLRLHVRSILRLLIDRNLRSPFTIQLPQGASAASTMKTSQMRALELEAEKYWYYEHAVDDQLFPVKGTPPGQQAMKLMFELPHVVPFSRRVTYLHSFITADRARFSMDKIKYGVKIRRTHPIADGYDQIMKVPVQDAPLLRARLHVTFIDQHGQEEAGIDAGGVFKEFMEQLLNQAFQPQFGLFTCLEGSNELFPNAHAMKLFASEKDCLDHYRFLGRVLGKAIYESCVVPLYFAPFFVNNLLGRGNSLDDLRKLDEQQYRSLQQLKELDDVEDAYLFFSVEDEFLGNTVTTDLCEGGRDIPVTNDNVVRYMHTVAYYRLSLATQPHTRAFREGLLDLLDKSWLALFNASEFQQLISGGKSSDKLDIDELKKYTKLVGGYQADDRTLKLLYEVLDEMSVEDQGRFLQFVTGSSRPPLLGFSAMNPPLSIRRTDNKSNFNLIVDIDRLPTASTCFNLLKLPPYMNKTNLKEKLLTAIRSGAGFDLS